MKSTFLLALGLLFLASCDRDNQEDAAQTPILPVKITDGSTVVNIKYNNDKILEMEAVGEGKNTFEYSGGLITKVNIGLGSDYQRSTTLTYDGTRLSSTQMTGKDGSNQLSAITTFTYNANGTVTAISKYTDGNSSGTSTVVYTLSNGQIVKAVNTDGGYTSTKAINYDDKNGIFKNVRGYANAALVLEEEMGGTFSSTQNNYAVVTEVKQAPYYTLQMTSKYNYELNSANYPTKITESYVYGSGAPETTTYTITYNK